MSKDEAYRIWDWFWHNPARIIGVIGSGICILIGVLITLINSMITAKDDWGTQRDPRAVHIENVHCPKGFSYVHDTINGYWCGSKHIIHSAIWDWNIIWYSMIPLALTILIPIFNYAVLSYRQRGYRRELRESKAMKKVLVENERLDNLLKKIT